MLLGGDGVDGKPIEVNARDVYGVTILMLASQYGHVEMTRPILDHGADPNLEDRQARTVLLRAEEGGHAEVADLLRQAGAKE